MRVEDITQYVRTGELTHRQAIHLFSAVFGVTVSPTQFMLPCEYCGVDFPYSHACSYKIWMPHPGHPSVAGFELNIDTTCNGQHYCCSPECARDMAIRCLQDHHHTVMKETIANANTTQITLLAARSGE